MDTRNLLAFKRCFELRSMSKAADELYVSKQGLSKMIGRLEAELGHLLFFRSNRGIEPTPYAMALYPKARRLATLLESIERDASSGDQTTELPVASTSGYLVFCGDAFKRELEAACPGVRLVIQEGNDELACSFVANGTTECGVVAGPVDYARFDARFLRSHPYVLITNADDPLAHSGHVGYAGLARRRVAIMGPGFSPYSQIQASFAHAGVHDVTFVGVAELPTALTLVSRGELVCITVDFAQTLNDTSSLAVIPFEDPSFTWDTYLVTPKGAEPSDACRSFADFTASWLAERFPHQG